MRGLRMLVTLGVAALAVGAAAPALAASPSPSPSPAPSTGPSGGASPSTSPSTSPSGSVAPSPSTGRRGVTAAFDRDVGYQGDHVTLTVTVHGGDRYAAGTVRIHHLWGLLQYRTYRSDQPCVVLEPDDALACELPAGTGTARYAATFAVGELARWPVPYSLHVRVDVGGQTLRTTAKLTLTVDQSASPSPSSSASPSASPSGSPSGSAAPSAPVSTTPAGGSTSGGLPVTGISLAIIGAVAVALLATGTAAVVAARRRRGLS